MTVRYRSRFKKDYRLLMKQGKNIAELDYVIEQLAVPNMLSEKYQDHSLKGEYFGYKECHVEPDWLLIYGYETLENDESQLLLVRNGSHSELFE